jgi:hypothetical protein
VTTASIVEVLKAHLAKEGLVLCKLNDTQFPLDGFKENDALTHIVEVVDDAQAVAEWVDSDTPTAPVEAKVLAALTKASA